MASWSIIYLTIGVVVLIAAVWRVARNGNLFLALAGITYCVGIALLFFFQELYGLLVIPGLPPLGRILQYIALPVFIGIAILSIKHR